MSGSSLDGLDIAYVEFSETAGKWEYEIKCAACIEYGADWARKLREATGLPAVDYQVLHTDYGRYLGERVLDFVEEFQLQHRVNMISSHGHTTFHMPQKKMTHQLGEGAALAAASGLPVVSDLRSMDIAFGGQGAPIVPVGEKVLFPEYHYFLNIGGIANISMNRQDEITAFDVCAANRVLNMLSAEKNKPFDEGGKMASAGKINGELLAKLDSLTYYALPHPKSLANDFGTDVVYPLIQSFHLETEDSLCTYVEHMAVQVRNSLQAAFSNAETGKILITGGGAFNTFLIRQISKKLEEINFEVHVPVNEVVIYKEALIMALLGVLRWREQYTVLASVTGATRNSIGGALWLPTEA
jgi:anhydro-N-acetylmuramic acid kinase